jgi:hypothetical protein
MPLKLSAGPFTVYVLTDKTVHFTLYSLLGAVFNCVGQKQGSSLAKKGSVE